MKAKKEQYTDFIKLLNLAEDYYTSGYKTARKHYKVRKNTGVNLNSQDRIKKINEEIINCTKCRLHEKRKKPVPGEGVVNPYVMIIGEGPGAEEDKTGRPFVGRAGQYLDKWLSAVKLNNGTVLCRKTNVFIGNIIKCRPPGNRDPKQDEIDLCRPFLERQIEILKPKLILTISRFAAQLLLNTTTGITRLRGNVYEYKNIPLVPTYHPSAVLRNPELRAPVWEDLKILKSVLEKNL